MNRSQKPLEVLVYQDVLCAWCYVADTRLDVLRMEFGDALRWKTRPYPLRIHDALPTEKELAECVEEIRRAKEEPEGFKLAAELWTDGDPPRSSVPALAALEAAGLQGSPARILLARAMQRAALESGINVTRSDVVFELASQVGLDMNRFSAAFQAPETKRLILEEHKLAGNRGVKGVPALVLGGKWMVSGLREISEYREHIIDCLKKHTLAHIRSTDHSLH
jgi:predicted DsbA family dithiol-disulfide isomerase